MTTSLSPLAPDVLFMAKKPTEELPPVEAYRTRFVGDIDLDEKDEPLLKETNRRFVLFPIQYHEVRVYPTPIRLVC